MEPEVVAAAYERMIARAEADGECLIGAGARNGNGYLIVRVGKSLMLGHRLAFLHRHGWLPAVVRHDCDRPDCLAERCHLPGTQADNVADMIAKGRMRVVRLRGEQSPKAKLTESQVRQIRRLSARGRTGAELARRFGVSESCTSNIIAGRSWQHVA